MPLCSPLRDRSLGFTISLGASLRHSSFDRQPTDSRSAGPNGPYFYYRYSPRRPPFERASTRFAHRDLPTELGGEKKQRACYPRGSSLTGPLTRAVASPSRRSAQCQRDSLSLTLAFSLPRRSQHAPTLPRLATTRQMSLQKSRHPSASRDAARYAHPRTRVVRACATDATTRRARFSPPSPEKLDGTIYRMSLRFLAFTVD